MKLARFRDLPIRSKLRLINLVTVSISFLVVMLILVVYTWFAARAEMGEGTMAKAELIAANVAPALMFNDRVAAKETLASLRFTPEVMAAALYDSTGQRFVMYGRQQGADAGTPVPERLAAGAGLYFERGYLDVVVPIRHESQQEGMFLMREDFSPIFSRLLVFTGVLVAAGIVAMVLGTGLLNRLQGAITDRITRLAALMQRVSLDKDYSSRADFSEGGDEIHSLAESFNEMLGQIQIRDGELGHELNERRHAEKKLEKLAHYDTLTHLPNRHYFNLHLDEQMATLREMEGSLGLMFIDLDNFKYVNDTFGHHAGDELLVAVAQRLRNLVRSGDVIARLGGDEFAVLLNQVGHPAQVEAVAQKMIDAVSRAIAIGGNEVHVGASIGIALAPLHAEDAAGLVRNADAAMYRAKQAGKSQHRVWQPEMGEQVTRRYQLESGLRKAREQGELALHYQPIHDLETGQLLGLEALLRWQHPQLGPISPDEFIPVAEESGQIEAISYWVLEEASSQLALWRKRHPGLYVAVNLSSRQFVDERLADRIASVIGAHGLPTRAIELEVTEGLLLEASSRVQQTLNRFAELGLAVALDDFGTGYSSLAYLTRFPFSKIKIDRGFVTQLGQSPRSAGIVQAIVGMGQSLQMKVVAEGVETEAQRTWLMSIGCQVGQGYLFNRPLNVETLGRLLEELPPIGEVEAAPSSRLKLVN